MFEIKWEMKNYFFLNAVGKIKSSNLTTDENLPDSVSAVSSNITSELFSKTLKCITHHRIIEWPGLQ